MILRTIGKTAIVLACAFMPATLLAAPVYGPIDEFDGRHYQVVVHNGVSWASAKTAAEAQTFEGVAGHLATLTSEAEDIFVESLRSGAGLSNAEVWVGGSQQSCIPEAPGCGWQWLNDEGPISTPQEPLLSYSNWLANEPNDNTGPGSEQHLGIGLGDVFGWNDEGALGNIGGYVIEYDTATIVDPVLCLSGGPGCETTAGQTMTLPPVVLQEDASIGVRTFEFTDNPSRCGVSPLVLFGGTDLRPDLIIPPYLCGSPKFMVVEVDTEGFEIAQGTILVENEPADALPGNLYECTGPIVEPPLPDLDPQHRDVVAWQATDHTAMLENDLGATVSSVFAGALGEFTFECGSSRGKIKSASYYVIGLHIDFGPGFELEANAAGNHAMFVALTRYKLLLLRASVVESKPALKKIVFTALQLLANTAIRLHDRGRYEAALATIKLFLLGAENVAYTPIPGENYNGEHLMRGSNIEFMYEEKVIPFAL
ncbi:MAG: hypothetical protein WD795_10755 [Woeseia sp.]